jgi:AcrR family transcriptional regulator
MSATGSARRRRTQVERRAETRAALLDAGERVFVRRGFHGGGLEEVADEAGVSRGSVYYHFQDKASLFVAIVRRRCEARAAALEERAVMLPSPAPLGETRLLVEFAAYAAEHPAARAELDDALRACRAAVAGAISNVLRERGVEPSMPVEQLAGGMLALSAGMAIEQAIGHELPSELLPELIEVLIAGLEHLQNREEATP